MWMEGGGCQKKESKDRAMQGRQKEQNKTFASPVVNIGLPRDAPNCAGEEQNGSRIELLFTGFPLLS